MTLRTTNQGLFFTIGLIVFVFGLGWFLNIQNFWEYWPETGRLGDAGGKLVFSVIGFFIPPIGCVTGWLW